MKMKTCMAIALLSLAMAATGATYYVNPSTDPVTGGNDAWDGTCEVWEGGESLHGPKQTLVGVMEVATASGDVVIALPGTYDSRMVETEIADQYVRVIIPAGVTLKSKYGAKATIIMGRAADTSAEGEYGCGSGSPARCAQLNANSRLEGFTLTGGRTLSAQSAGGVKCSAASSLVVNCIISNNVAKSGGAAHTGSFFGCKFLFNRSLDTSYPCNTAYYGASTFVNCFFDCNPTKDLPSGAEFYTGAAGRRITVVNCTFGSHLKQLYTGSKGGIDLYNCIDLSESGAPYGIYTNSAYLVKHKNATVDATSFKTTVAAMKLNDDGSLKASSTAINAGDTSFYNAKVPASFNSLKDIDITGLPRVVGDSIDLGCCEYNPDPNPNPKNWYVAPSGSDSNSGESAEQAFRTLAMAGKVADWVMRSGDVINVAPGTYDEGVNDENFVVRSRIHLPKGITLKSTAGAAQTIIKGAASTDEYATEYGNGTNAVRCVSMEEGAKVVGFTLTGGRTSLPGGSQQENRGGGAYASGAAWLIDCVVSNNMASGRGGAINSNVRSLRCRYIRNAAEDLSMVVYYGPTAFFDCYFAENARGADSYAVYAPGESSKISLYNCTFEAGGDQQAVYTAVACYNCLFRCPTRSTGLTEFYSCAFAEAPASYQAFDENCIVKRASQLAIDAGGRPKKGSLCIDAGSNVLYTASYPFSVEDYIDLYGTNRICNGRIDIGCCEYVPSDNGLVLILK